ncbi:tetratricopeptide repeat protein [uncultured Muribaculum sp.]|uniref:tetratricopeptide repeat protein n=1 Tax=uncultured Muribaculum sp. TaxID=1918613 RepID=UPI0025E491EE|nr:tetratricopeptide repeat protein [uncultured Muribaculum sp.]
MNLRKHICILRVAPLVSLAAIALYPGIRAIADTPRTGSQDEYFDLMGKADTAISDRNWDEAEQYLLRALSTDPANPSNVLILSNLGIVQYNLGRDSLALRSLDEAHRKAPRSVTVLSNRADVLLAMGRDSLANNDYASITRLDSTNVDARYMHAMLSLRQGDTVACHRQCDLLLEIAPDSLQTGIACASLFTATEQWEKAIPFYTKVIDKDPSSHFYGARAVCYLMTGRLNEASADITTGLEHNPDDKELYLYRAYLNKMRYMHDDAIDDLRRALNSPK